MKNEFEKQLDCLRTDFPDCEYEITVSAKGHSHEIFTDKVKISDEILSILNKFHNFNKPKPTFKDICRSFAEKEIIVSCDKLEGTKVIKEETFLFDGLPKDSYYLVSKYFARLLEEHNETIVKQDDFHIWARKSLGDLGEDPTIIKIMKSFSPSKPKVDIEYEDEVI